MVRARTLAITAAAILLAGTLLAVGVAATRDGGSCDTERCKARQHERLARHCRENPEDERCERLRAHDQQHAERVRQHCAEHPDDERCRQHDGQADARRAERIRQHCAEHPDDERCA